MQLFFFASIIVFEESGSDVRISIETNVVIYPQIHLQDLNVFSVLDITQDTIMSEREMHYRFNFD